MTKRFTLKESDIYNCNDVIHDNGIELPQSTACDLLNDLHEENEELKQQNKELQEFKDNYDKNMELMQNSEYVQDFLFGNL